MNYWFLNAIDLQFAMQAIDLHVSLWANDGFFMPTSLMADGIVDKKIMGGGYAHI